MNKIFSPEAWDDYVYWQNQDKKTLKKINALIKDIQHSGAECGIGKPEALKGELSGFWSIRIDEKNRLVYRVTGSNLEIVSCKTHYGDH